MRVFRSFWRNLFGRAAVEREMAEELAFHIDARAADLMARHGLSRPEAMRRARIEFGCVEKYKEEARASRGLRLLDELRSDLRVAGRMLARNRGFSVAAVAILALGIGANTAVFSVVDAMLFYELPVDDPGELVAFDSVHRRDSMVAGYQGSSRPGPAGTSLRTSFPTMTFERFRDAGATLSHVFAFAPMGAVTVVADGLAETASAQIVSGEYFGGLGVSASLGRTLGPSDDRPDAEAAVVVSHRYWQRRFLGDPDIVGKTISVNRAVFTIVGVTEPTFHGTEVTETVDISAPLAMATRISPAEPMSSWWLLMMGRLDAGATREQVLAELQPVFRETVVTAWAARPSQTRDPWRSGMPVLRVMPGAQGPNGASPTARGNLAFLMAVTGLVLLVACVNVASLLLVRAANRRQEMSMRRALGAGRARLIRQLLSESLLLAAAGAAAGVTLATWGKDLLPRMFEADVVLETAIDLRALGFAAAAAAVTALVFGMAHAVRATDVGLVPWLKPGTAGAQRARTARVLVGLQMAASLVLLVVAGLFVRTLYNYSRVDVGFDPTSMLVFQIDPGQPSGTGTSTYDLYERLSGAIESVPGVRSVTMSAVPLVARSHWLDEVRADDASDARGASVQLVRWNFFETMGMPILAGRTLESTDTGGAPRVAVVNQAMARQLFGTADPVGRHFQFVNGPNRGVPIRVVGVVRDSKYSNLGEPAPPTFFMPYTQQPPRRMTIEVRTAGEPLALADEIRAAVREVDPGLPLIGVRTQEQQIAGTIQGQRTFALLTGVSGAVGLLLACVGLYGLVSYDAKRRTTEIGIRMALGAHRADVVRLVMGQMLWIVAPGALFGLVVSAFAARLVASQLFGVRPLDVWSVSAGIAVLVGVASLAAYLPARRASQLDPTDALRSE